MTTHLRRRRANLQRFSQIGQMAAQQSRASQNMSAAAPPAMRRVVSGGWRAGVQGRGDGIGGAVLEGSGVSFTAVLNSIGCVWHFGCSYFQCRR